MRAQEAGNTNLTMRATLLVVSVGLLIGLFCTDAEARNLVSQEKALAAVFPQGTSLERQTLFLDTKQIDRAETLSGEEIDQELVIRYVGTRNGRIEGYAYFDAHRVRTLPETVMIVLEADGTIRQIEVVAFSEPADYFPSNRWLEQFAGAQLDRELSLKRAIRPITGATLTGRAITNASRRILAIHTAVEE